jgi:initiation factor 1A
MGKKNTFGGKKTKACPRFNAPSTFRPAKEDGEIYAVIEKNMGNGILNVLCIDGVIRTCIVRKKFLGQRDIKLGGWVLVGLREFETKQNKCDLLEVYSSSDVTRLQTLDGHWHVLLKEQPSDIEFIETVDIPESAPVELDLGDIDIDDI